MSSNATYATSTPRWLGATTGVPDHLGGPAELEPVPTALRLYPSRPNPSFAGMSIRFDLPTAATTSLSIFSVGGRLVRSVVIEESMAAGKYAFEWDGRDDRGQRVGAGVYLYRLEAGEVRLVRRLTLLR